MKRLISLLSSLGLVWIIGPVTAQRVAPWTGSYFDNPYLSGEPIAIRSDGAIRFDWGTGSPDLNLPPDRFSVRWGTAGELAAGTYLFVVTADEAFRLSVDGQIILDTWDQPVPGTTFNVQVPLDGGLHHIQLDYRDDNGSAYVNLDWGLAPGSNTPPEEAITAPESVFITASLLNVRSEPRIANNIITRVGRGQQFPMLQHSADRLWVQIDLRNGSRGWVNAAFVNITNRSLDTGLSGLSLRSNAQLLIREAASVDARPIGLLEVGEVVRILGRNQELTWWQIEDGFQIGWVNAQYVRISPDVDPASIVVINTAPPDPATQE